MNGVARWLAFARVRVRSTLLAIGLMLVGLVSPASAGAYLYWTDQTVQSPGVELIGRAETDGSGADHDFIDTEGPSSVAVDGNYIYWSSVSGWIGRANLDGSGANPYFIHASIAFYYPRRVAVDAGHVYWTTLFGGTIGRAKLDGSEVEPEFLVAEDPYGLAVGGGYLYWTNYQQNSIERANLGTLQIEGSLVTGLSAPVGLAVDGQHIYWANYNKRIGRANLDGSMADQNFVTGVVEPTEVAVDASHLYWSEDGPGKIGRANLDGSEPSSNFITGIAHPYGLAVDSGGPGEAGNTPPPPPPSPPAASPPPPGPPAPIGLAPSNRFPTPKLKLDSKAGSATLTTTVPGPGNLVLSGAGIHTLRKHTNGPERVTLVVKPSAKTIKVLNHGGRTRVKGSLTFTPIGGKPFTRKLMLTLTKG
jgi:hypothetical protein